MADGSCADLGQLWLRCHYCFLQQAVSSSSRLQTVQQTVQHTMQHTVQQQHIAHSAAYSAAAADCTQCSIIAVQHTMQQTMQQQHNCTQLHICHSSLASWLPGHPRWVQPAALAGSERSLRRRTGSLFCRSSLWAPLRQPGFTLFCAFSGQNGSACTSRGSSSSSAVCGSCSSPSPT